MSGAHFAVVSIATALVLSAWSWMNARRQPRTGGGVTGTIAPGRVSAVTITIVGVALLTFGAWRAMTVDDTGGLAIALIGAMLALFMGVSLHPAHRVTWDAVGIYGPSRTFGPSLALERTRLAWDEVVRRGETMTGYSFVAAADRRRVYWSRYYPGHGHLGAAISRRAANLT